MNSNEKAEKIFLNLLLREQNLISYIDIINVNYFSTLQTQSIFNAIYKLFVSNSPINDATIEQLAKENCAFLFIENKDRIETYYNIIRNNYIKRELTTLANKLNDDTKTADQLLAQTETTLDLLTLNQKTDTSGQSLIHQAMQSTKIAYDIRSKFGIAGISMIHPEVDGILQGLKPGTLNILAARPSTGKSLYGIHVLINSALIYKIPSLMISLEMKEDKVGQRIISNLLNIKFSALDTGYLSKDDLAKIYFPKICKNCDSNSFVTQIQYENYNVINVCKKCGSENIETALDEIHKNNTLFINDAPGLSLFKVLASIKSHKMRYSDLGLVVIDHMGEINEANSKENEENRLARIIKSIRDMARQLNIAVLLLCQLNRDMEKENREPESRDLRGSGRLEEHADSIIMLYRDILGKTQKNNILKCIITKNRNGQIGMCNIPIDLEYQKILQTKAVIDTI